MSLQTPLPFLLGAQYYRAPTPEPKCWASDLACMREMGMNAVKFWVQWRWSHLRGDRFVFDDLDRLMDLAAQNHLQVTLNLILDVAPHWLYEKYPDAKQIMANGRTVEPYGVAQRQIGGHPGPCYNHPGALAERQKFTREVIAHFRQHPALAMWDVWNEPEISFPQRSAHIDTLVCYCPHCQAAFIQWLQAKYASLDQLNQVWGRCYETWGEVEVPRSVQAFTDFVDWREFHIQTMTREAAWRLDAARQQDGAHVNYLHVVPNTLTAFNPVSCAVDDFEMAALCDVFAATMNGGPVMAQEVLSAARGKTCYNVESHLNYGSTAMHQRVLTLNDLLKDWLPQIAMGIRGFLFWQYRPEVLGLESPAWGLVNLDGTDRPITLAVRTFIEKMAPHLQALMDCQPLPPQVGIWKSRKNEIFHFAMHGNFDTLVDSQEGYIQTLYQMNVPYRFISGEMLEKGELDGLKILILPSPYLMTEPEAAHLDTWVRQGGVVVAEAHLAGYNSTSGRHSRVLPGCGLADAWGLRETGATSSYHLHTDAFAGAQTAALCDSSIPEDVRKAMADFAVAGGMYFPIQLTGGPVAWGADRYAQLSGDGAQPGGWFEPGVPCLVSKTVGAGAVYYAATHLGQGAKKNSAGLVAWLQKALDRAKVKPTAGLKGVGLSAVRVGLISNSNGPHYLVIFNTSDQEQVVQMDPLPDGTGLFTGHKLSLSRGASLTVPAGFIDIVTLSGNIE